MSKPLITKRPSKRFPELSVLKYSKQVFFKNLWSEDPTLLEARGHVVDANDNVVIRPFTKVFNFGENGTKIHRDAICIWIEKINGFMAAATYVESAGQVIVSTTGSLDSDFVDMAREIIPQEMIDFISTKAHGTTFLFEIVHPNDPHIVPEKEGAYLIGAREVADASPFHTCYQTEETLDNIAKQCGVGRPTWGVARFDRIVDAVKTIEREGVMAYTVEAPLTALKIKSPYYLALKAAARRKDIMALNKERIDEEFFGLVDHLKELGDDFNEKSEQERLDYMREWLIENPWSV